MGGGRYEVGSGGETASGPLPSSLGLFSSGRPTSPVKLGDCTAPFASSAASEDNTEVSIAPEEELAVSLAATSAATFAADVSLELFSADSVVTGILI